MRDPLAWSIPLGRLFGITIRVHWLFPVVAIGLILRAASKEAVAGTWIDVAMILGLLFGSVLLHEFGHCFGARRVNGDASEILIWPLGGLASVDVPQTPRANFVMVAAGPAVNLLLCVACGLLLAFAVHQSYRPPWNPFDAPLRNAVSGTITLGVWGGAPDDTVSGPGAIVLARLFWVNWALFLLNVLLVGFPMDGGRMLQCALWPSFGYHRATLAVVFTGFGVMFVIGLAAIIYNELLVLCLAIMIYFASKHQWFVLETGGEESLFGYDFSQGYTSLEREQPVAAPARRRPSWWQRWLQRRAARKLQKEQEDREAEERRMDALLEKVQREGITSLTDEERRFMKRVSDRYRNNK